MKRALESVHLTEDGVVVLHLSDQETWLGPAGVANSLSRIIAATNGSLKKSGTMGATMVAKDNRIHSLSITECSCPRATIFDFAIACGDLACS